MVNSIVICHRSMEDKVTTGAKAQRWMKEISASQNVINQLVEENYELKQILRQLLTTEQKDVGPDPNTSTS